MKLLLLTLKIVMVIVVLVAVRICGYDRRCPHSSQRDFRINSECSGNSTVYNCLYNTKHKTYTEFCEKNEEARAGLKYVISGTYRNVKCSEERFQPFTFWTNRSTTCLYLKSPCSESGQLVFDNTSTIGDSSCRCDYTRHYAFLSLPRNPCFCKPSVDDCSCYIKQCPNNTTLSPDYECMYLNSTKKSFNCNPVFYTRTNGSDIDTLPKGTEQFQPRIESFRTTLAVKIVCICLTAVILVVMYVIYHNTFEGRPSRYDLIPSFEVQPKNVTVQICDGFILECRVLSKYPVIYDWYKNHEIIKRSDQPFYEVKAAYKADTGTYECRARNQLGETRSDVVKVTVMLGKTEEPLVDPEGPTEIEIISNPKTVIIEFGGDCLFSCEARCSIPLVYQWLKDGVPIESEIKPSLVLKKLQNYDHQGLYTCMVSIPGTKTIRLSYPASLSIKTNDKPEFNPSDKVALLIGNFDHRRESPLSAPKSDVYTMSEIFRSLDFKVVSLLNLTKLEMQSAVEEFVKLIGSEVYAVFYFCGHGFEDEAKCYLVPPDARHGYTIEDCVCAEDVLSQMQNYTETSPALIVLILDICRVRNLQPPTNREQDAMCSNLSNIPMKGNTVFCYATSKGMYAYEDIQNGILVKYLKKYLPKQMSVLDVFTSVQEDIGKESQYYHIQIPEIKSNLLQPRRSLADRISTKGHTKAYNQRTLLWNNAHEKPPSKEIEIPAIYGKLLLEFQSEFSNMLTIFCTVMPMTMGKSLKYHLGCIAHLPKTISIFGSVSQVHDDPPKTKIVLQDLQKLTKDLEVQVFVVNTETKQRYEGPTVNLGKPLVGILDLWKPRRQPIECSESM